MKLIYMNQMAFEKCLFFENFIIKNQNSICDK